MSDMVINEGWADFFLGEEPEELAWLGTITMGGEPISHQDGAHAGVWYSVLKASTSHDYLDEVNRTLLFLRDNSVPNVDRNRWPGAAGTCSEWAYTWSWSRGEVLVSYRSSAWIPVKKLYDKRERRIPFDQIWKIAPNAAVVHDNLRQLQLPNLGDDSVYFDPNKVAAFDDATQFAVQVSCNRDTIFPLVEILQKLAYLGSLGASREVTFEEFGSVFFDGDGSHRLKSILVNGLLLKDWEDYYRRRGAIHHRPTPTDDEVMESCLRAEAKH